MSAPTTTQYPPFQAPIADQKDGLRVSREWLIFFQNLAAQGSAGAGAVTGSGLTNNELILGAGGTAIKAVAATDGEVPIGKTSDGSVTLATLTAGSGISITNGPASVTIASVGGGTVTTTGSPASGNLTKFSGATSITNGDLSGDVSTSGTLVTTLANTAVTPASYGDATHVATFTVDGKGRLTAAANVAITFPTTADYVLMSDGANPPNPINDGAGNFVYVGYTP